MRTEILRIEWSCRVCRFRFVSRADSVAQGSCPSCHTVSTPFGPAVRPAYGEPELPEPEPVEDDELLARLVATFPPVAPRRN